MPKKYLNRDLESSSLVPESVLDYYIILLYPLFFKLGKRKRMLEDIIKTICKEYKRCTSKW